MKHPERAPSKSAVRVIDMATDADEPDDPELRQRAPHATAARQEATIVEPPRRPPEDLVWRRCSYSPFPDADSGRTLRAPGIPRLHVTGLHTDGSGRSTSGDAFQRGSDLVWVTDALDTFTPEAHRRTLEYVGTRYATDPPRQLRTAKQITNEWSTGPRRET